MSESDENSVHYISEDSDDITETEKIIREKIKNFENEKDAVRLILSEHFRKFRSKFFAEVKNSHKSIVQSIKQAIRNCLNPYRIFLKEEKLECENELKALYNELKAYYNNKNFNNTFFINYFKDLKNAHEKKSKSKFINMLPKNEEEVLNDIHKKVMLIKNLNIYLTQTIFDFIQKINLDEVQEKENETKDEYIMMYQYLVIKKDSFSKMNEEDFNKNISNIKSSNKLRRPINDFGNYNYLPILCKGHCRQEAELFILALEKEINQNHIHCKECENLKINFNSINSKIRNLYSKTCIFSHNINEIMFHPLFFLCLENISFYSSELNFERDFSGFETLNKIITNKIPNKYINLKNYKIRKLYNESESSIIKIIKLIKEYSYKSNLFGGSCFLPQYKTKKCSLGLLKPSKSDWLIHKIKCPKYHSNLERRRIFRIKKNKICKHALIGDGAQWISDTENIDCEEGDNCDGFHTRNELFFDERNFRKLYPCNEYGSKDGKIIFCKKFEMCPRKHPTDIKIDEIYLPYNDKIELKRELAKLKYKNSTIEKKIKNFEKIECKFCFNYIDGKDERYLVFFTNCNHKICSKCFDYCKLCPLCDNIYSNPENIIVKLNMQNIQEGEKEEDNIDLQDSNNEEEENDDESDKDIENEAFMKINDSQNLEETFDPQKYNPIMKNNESQLQNINNSMEKYDEKDNSYSYNRGRGKRGRGNRGRGRGRGRERGRERGGERGRERGRARGRGRGRGNYD